MVVLPLGWPGIILDFHATLSFPGKDVPDSLARSFTTNEKNLLLVFSCFYLREKKLGRRNAAAPKYEMK